MKKVSIFGSTGTIGQKAANIVKNNKEKYEIEAISGNNNYELLISQAKELLPKYVVVCNPVYYSLVKESLTEFKTEVLPSEELNNIAKINVNTFVMAISGSSGISSTFSALGHAKNIALATKEVVVCGGSYFMKESFRKQTKIIPIDSEHNAIYQCLEGENMKNVSKIILTASGGSFIDFDSKDLEKVTLEQALRHPNWNMGKKITIDSSTLFNKSMEIIEAAYLFDVNINKIEAVIHPQSIIHGMVLFEDGSVKAILSVPDMSIPIQYSLEYPDRSENKLIEKLDFSKSFSLEFKEKKDWQQKSLDVAYESFYEKKCIAFNSFNEEAVSDFLKEKIKFSDIYKIVKKRLDQVKHKENISSVEDIIEYINFYKNSRGSE